MGFTAANGALLIIRTGTGTPNLIGTMKCMCSRLKDFAEIMSNKDWASDALLKKTKKMGLSALLAQREHCLCTGGSCWTVECN